MSRPAKVLLCLAVVALGVGASNAQTVNWQYVEGGLARIDPDKLSGENGWFVGGSWQFVGWLHVFGEFGDQGPFNPWQVGAGWHGLLGERADLFADGAFYDADYDDGARVRFGARWMAFKRIEINGNLGWTNLGDGSNESIAANAIWYFSKRFSFGGGFERGDEFNTARAFVRFNFGPTG